MDCGPTTLPKFWKRVLGGPVFAFVRLQPAI